MSEKAKSFLIKAEEELIPKHEHGVMATERTSYLLMVIALARHAVELGEFGSGCSTREDPVCMEEFPENKEMWCRNCLAIEAYQKTVEGLPGVDNE